MAKKPSTHETIFSAVKDVAFGTARKSQTATGGRKLDEARKIKNIAGNAVVNGIGNVIKGTVTRNEAVKTAGMTTVAIGMLSRQVATSQIARVSAQDALLAKAQGGSAALGARGVAAPGHAAQPSSGRIVLNGKKLRESVNEGMALAQKPKGGGGLLSSVSRGIIDKFSRANAEQTKTDLGRKPQQAASASGNGNLEKTKGEEGSKGSYQTIDGRNVQGTPAQQAAWTARRRTA